MQLNNKALIVPSTLSQQLELANNASVDRVIRDITA